MHVVLVAGPRRAHKLAVLLEGYDVSPVRGPRDIAPLRRLARKRSVVLVDSPGRVALLAFLACMVSWSPLVYRVRGAAFEQELLMFRAKRGIARWGRFLGNTTLMAICLRFARGILYNSAWTRDALGRHDRAKYRAIVHNPYTPPPGTSASTGSMPDATYRLLSATNMDKSSKMQTMCDAITDWIPRSFWDESDACWLICGGGLHEDRLRDLVAEHGLDHRIHVLGRVDYLPALYEWCDVFVHLTYSDAFPNTVMEAMVSGKPVLTNERSCGTREQVVHGVTGTVVEEGPGVTDALCAYREDADTRRRHGEAGRERVEQEFSVATQAARLRQALETMVP